MSHLDADYEDFDDEMDADARHFLDDDLSDEDEDRAYARLLRQQGQTCTCEKCGTPFRGLPGHGVCPPCADIEEFGP